MFALKAPASISALVLFGGLALTWWALTGLGVITTEGTAKQRITGIRDKLKER